MTIKNNNGITQANTTDSLKSIQHAPVIMTLGTMLWITFTVILQTTTVNSSLHNNILFIDRREHPHWSVRTHIMLQLLTEKSQLICNGNEMSHFTFFNSGLLYFQMVRYQATSEVITRGDAAYVRSWRFSLEWGRCKFKF